MNDRLVFSVKAKHIKQGVCEDPSKCALALAVLDSDKNILRVGLDVDDTYVEYRDGTVSYYNTSTRAARFISKFDNNKKKVKPASFIFTLRKEHTF